MKNSIIKKNLFFLSFLLLISCNKLDNTTSNEVNLVEGYFCQFVGKNYIPDYFKHFEYDKWNNLKYIYPEKEDDLNNYMFRIDDFIYDNNFIAYDTYNVYHMVDKKLKTYIDINRKINIEYDDEDRLLMCHINNREHNNIITEKWDGYNLIHTEKYKWDNDNLIHIDYIRNDETLSTELIYTDIELNMNIDIPFTIHSNIPFINKDYYYLPITGKNNKNLLKQSIFKSKSFDYKCNLLKYTLDSKNRIKTIIYKTAEKNKWFDDYVDCDDYNDNISICRYIIYYKDEDNEFEDGYYSSKKELDYFLHRENLKKYEKIK